MSISTNAKPALFDHETQFSISSWKTSKPIFKDGHTWVVINIADDGLPPSYTGKTCKLVRLEFRGQKTICERPDGVK